MTTYRIRCTGIHNRNMRTINVTFKDETDNNYKILKNSKDTTTLKRKKKKTVFYTVHRKTKTACETLYRFVFFQKTPTNNTPFKSDF